MISTTKIIIAVILISITFSVGYSFFSSELKINGNAEAIDTRPIIYDEYSKSESTWEITQEPWNTGEVYYYYIEVNLKNLDKNFDNWVLELYYPPYVVANKMSFWGSASGEVVRIGDYDVVRFTSQTWNGKVNLNETLTISFIMAYSQNLTLVTDHLVFNGLLVKNFTQIGTKYLVGTSTGDVGDPTGGQTGGIEEIENSNSTFTYTVGNSWNSGNNMKTYSLTMDFKNMDSSASSWKLLLDFDNTINENMISQWISPSNEVTDVDNKRRVKLVNFAYNGSLPVGNTLHFEMQVTIPSNEQLNISNVIFNNKKVVNITRK